MENAGKTTGMGMGIPWPQVSVHANRIPEGLKGLGKAMRSLEKGRNEGSER